ncbi:ATP-binding cassette domain-containing protein [Nostocoides sp. HKS02]|nr:ATP-binding cassette domain-containing protein [Tetrasphaera sp. HKS02]
MVELTHASFGYAERAVVQQATLTVRPGEVVAVLGPNGSGKSTLVRGLLGLNDQLGGEVRLFGQDRADFHDHARLGYVPQRHTLSASVRATVTEIVAVGRLPRRRWWKPVVRSAADDAMIARALDVVGLADRADADVSTLSGGQQRRVLIARALAADPDVLLMDEPTAGVDTANQQVLAQVLARLAQRGTTMLIVTHELEALDDIVTRIILVQGGRIAFDGSRAEFEARTSEVGRAGYSHDGYQRDGLHHDGHHHDDELAVDRHRLPGAPSAGPLDPRGGTHHG